MRYKSLNKHVVDILYQLNAKQKQNYANHIKAC